MKSVRGGQVGEVTIKSYLQKKMKLFPKGKSFYCFTPPTWLPRRYSIPGVKRNDCQKKHRLVEITQVYRQSEEIY